MNEDIIQGKWKQLTGRIKTQWGRLTNDDVDVADGHREYLVGRIQERYGYAREQAEDEVERFENSL